MQDKIKIDLETGMMTSVVSPDEVGEDIIETACTVPFYKPKWNGEAWEEGATQEYIDSLKSQPEEPTLEEKNRADIDYIAIMTGVEL
jgi:hypothetical protein